MHRRELLTTFATAGATAAATMAAGEPTLAADDNNAAPRVRRAPFIDAVTARSFIGGNGGAAARFCSRIPGA